MPYKKLVCEKQPVTLTNKFSLLTKICAHVSLQVFNIFFELLVHVFDISTEKQDYEKTIQKTIKFYGTNDFVSKSYHHRLKLLLRTKQADTITSLH